jgi:hypothetical protein
MLISHALIVHFSQVTFISIQDCIDDVIKLDCASDELPAPVCHNAAVTVRMAPSHGSAMLRSMPAFSDSFIACMCCFPDLSVL